MDSKQLKNHGLRFARSMQNAVKSVISFSVNHPAVEGTLKQSYDALNLILKECGNFTFGFVDQQVMLNKLLTQDPNLGRLQTEFLKRGIGAITFEPGLTFALFKRVVALLAVQTKEMEEAGGLRGYLHENPLEKVRIIPAPKNQKRTEEGDILLDTDSESFLMSKNTEEGSAQNVLSSVDQMLESAGLAFGPGGGSFMDHAEAGSELPGLGGGSGLGGGGGTGSGSGTGNGPEDADTLVGPERRGSGSGGAGQWGYKSFMEMVSATVEKNIVEHGDPQQATVGLARVIEGAKLDNVLKHFSPEKQEELKDASPEVVARELVTEKAFSWAGKKLQDDGGAIDAKVEVEEEVVRVLVRALEATQMADQLAGKLAKLITDHALPKSVQDRIQDELAWTALPIKARQSRLLEIEQCDAVRFRRLLQQLKDLVQQGWKSSVAELALHYFKFLDRKGDNIQVEELSRAVEVISAASIARADFVPTMVTRLTEALTREDLGGFKHFQIARCLTALSRNAALYEDFPIVITIGSELAKVNQQGPESHKKCCAAALKELLPQNAIARALELSLEQREDPTWSKVATNLLRWSDSSVIDVAFRMLEEEQIAKNRLSLIRLIAQLGSSAIPWACQRMESPQWFTVRNACIVLGELKDPELLAHIGPGLKHEDARVQQAAFGVVTKSRLPGQAACLAEALPSLSQNIAEQAYQELTFLKDPAAVPFFEAILQNPEGPADLHRKAVQILVVTPGEAAMATLVRAVGDARLDLVVRRQALAAVRRNPQMSGAVLAEIANSASDPLAAECRGVMAAAR